MSVCRIGVYHYGCHQEPAINGLERELYRRSSVLLPAAPEDDVHSLICLPEAINLAARYEDFLPRLGNPVRTLTSSDLDHATLDRLRGLARRFGTAFVAGILELDESKVYRNSAYLIRPSGYQRICRKRLPDSTRTYCPWPGTDDANPVTFSNVHLSVLICRDALDPATSNEIAALRPIQTGLKESATSTAELKIAAVPARATSEVPTSLVWRPDANVVLIANGRESAESKVVIASSEANRVFRVACNRSKNCLRLKSLPGT